MTSLNTGPILFGCRSIVHPMKMMVHLDAAAVNEWRSVLCFCRVIYYIDNFFFKNFSNANLVCHLINTSVACISVHFSEISG
jgi:hypothetical protein